MSVSLIQRGNGQLQFLLDAWLSDHLLFGVAFRPDFTAICLDDGQMRHDNIAPS